MREFTAYDRQYGRNRVRLLHHDGQVYIETHGNHDGVSVMTSVRLERAEFVEHIKELGVLP